VLYSLQRAKMHMRCGRDKLTEDKCSLVINNAIA